MKQKKSKHAQITLFIILAIVIVIGFLMFFSIRDRLVFNEISPEIKPIQNSVERCIEETAEEGIYHIGRTGGYFGSRENSLENGFAVYFDKGFLDVPGKKDVEEELAEYMDTMLFFCIKNFVGFPDFEVKQGEIKSEVFIEEGKVVFNIDYPLSIKKDESSFVLDKFSFEKEVRLFTILQVIDEISEAQALYPEDICVNCLEKMSIDNDILIRMYDYDIESIIFIIVDPKSEVKGDYYLFSFANKYEVEG